MIEELYWIAASSAESSGLAMRSTCAAASAGQGDDYGIELVGLQSRRYDPASGFALNGLHRER